MFHLLKMLIALVVAVILGLVLWQLSSYVWMGESSRIDTIINYLPVTNKSITFAYPRPESVKRLSESEVRYLEELLLRYYDNVYFDIKKIPSKYLVLKTVAGPKNKKTEEIVLNQGVEFNFRISNASLMYFEADYNIYASEQLQSARYHARYIWILGRWVPQ